MPPVEQNTVPFTVSAAKSLSELKTVGKARELPVVSDLEKMTTTFANQISENAHVQSAKQMVEDGMKSIVETETFNNIQGKVQELNENPRVQQTLTTVKCAVGQLDGYAANGLEKVTTAIPALNSPTPQLIETTKDAAVSYLSLATEYVASFGLAQLSLKLADKSLSIAEKTTKFFKADVKDGSMLGQTYSRLRKTRRALRAVKRAGERKSYLEKDSVARAGVIGTVASMISVNSLLGMVGLKLVADKKRVTDVAEETPEGDEQHRQISDLKGDLAGYKSEEDPDYLPESGDSLESTEESSDEEGEVEEAESKEAHDEAESKEPHEEAEEVQEETVLKN
eukprot:TRINITY_DN96_c0_g1_i14.p1 TRINITY_DN96_c0_g1~~TRINITY_DN96_c0_g1_i14.p1  ORF type:complete len:339 (-),score=121.97 TRINITY_DN96_c0_g1_i14:110-1126(-)